MSELSSAPYELVLEQLLVETMVVPAEACPALEGSRQKESALELASEGPWTEQKAEPKQA